MNKLFRGLKGALFDLRVVVGLCGLILSVVMHELFHIIMHWGEIAEINLFPDSHAIVEVIITPAHSYDLLVEEMLAYVVTVVTIVLAVTLIHDINDARDTRRVEQIIMPKDYGNALDAAEQRYRLRAILGLMRSGQ